LGRFFHPLRGTCVDFFLNLVSWPCLSHVCVDSMSQGVCYVCPSSWSSFVSLFHFQMKNVNVCHLTCFIGNGNCILFFLVLVILYPYTGVFLPFPPHTGDNT
jgi:hypothetical protein